jgi:peptide/nickel transport system ATP-binding protein
VNSPVLEVQDLTVEFRTSGRPARVLDDVSLSVDRGRVVGLIGESGSGKSTLALAIMQLLSPDAHVAAGDIRLKGRSLFGLPDRDLRSIRGREIAYVPQDAMSAMNPLLRVGFQVGEPLMLHRGVPPRTAAGEAVTLLERVHLPRAETRALDYPHQFSGGMLQRAMIAMGLALEPELIVADEPTTSLDVTVQAGILALFREIRDQRGTSILLITHDLGVVAEVCDSVVVLYAGRVVEAGPVRDVMTTPQHPYTQALLRATPTIGLEGNELEPILGQLPSPFDLPRGCRFADRCRSRFAACEEEPPLFQAGDNRKVRCWLNDDSVRRG